MAQSLKYKNRPFTLSVTEQNEIQVSIYMNPGEVWFVARETSEGGFLVKGEFSFLPKEDQAYFLKLIVTALDK